MATPALWSPAPTPLILAEDELHVWRTPLRCAPTVLRQYEDVLSPDEKERAGRFLVADAKEDFVAARGVLRTFLAVYLGSEASQISLDYGKYGKPLLRSGANGLPLHFNASHSQGYAAFAFARRAEVGIDIEKIREEVAGEEIAARFFSEQEIAELAMLPPETKAEGFFKCWTRKEALIKARGEGLQIPLRRFCVSVNTDEPEEVLDGDGLTWVVHSFEPAAGFVGAVASGGKNWRVRYLDWQPKNEPGQRI